jgi:hypothetical protein
LKSLLCANCTASRRRTSARVTSGSWVRETRTQCEEMRRKYERVVEKNEKKQRAKGIEERRKSAQNNAVKINMIMANVTDADSQSEYSRNRNIQTKYLVFRIHINRLVVVAFRRRRL